ncbi:MAG: helix-turn-helix transcriptional regulator [Candidatus Beckwithbacteria bacterium]|nr:helix-turn-helix transcriptional regulator [Patescibacteria group bacterium]
MDWQTHKKQLLKNPKFKQALKESRLEYKIARTVIKARLKHQLTQKQLAKKLNTQQSVISRVENAQTTTSVSFLKRLANIFGGELKISFSGI